jgi:hypothetical protein
LVIRTPRGRKLTAAGYSHLGINLPAGADQSSGDAPTPQGRLFN